MSTYSSIEQSIDQSIDPLTDRWIDGYIACPFHCFAPRAVSVLCSLSFPASFPLCCLAFEKWINRESKSRYRERFAPSEPVGFLLSCSSGYSSPPEEGSSASVGSGSGSGSGRPHTLPILETTPDSPQTANAGSGSNADISNADFSEKLHQQQQQPLLQLSSPTASRRISSGSTLKHIGNFGLQLAVTPSFGECSSLSPRVDGRSFSPRPQQRNTSSCLLSCLFISSFIRLCVCLYHTHRTLPY